MHIVEHGKERVVEAEHIVVVVDKLVDESIVGISIASYARIVGQSSADIEVFRVILVKHSVCNVWNISASIGFASDVYLEVLDAKNLLEVFEEADKVCSNVLFTSCGHFADGKACADRLFDPKYICQVDPAVEIGLC